VAFEALLKVVDEVFSITFEDTQRAREILLAGAQPISARDALHIAVMERERVTQIMTFDAGFDQAQQVQRLRS
jgi:predicted nucleic acid-binding protein